MTSRYVPCRADQPAARARVAALTQATTCSEVYGLLHHRLPGTGLGGTFDMAVA